METNTLVSVIIPVYNGERFLPDAIQSILSQDYRPIEIIVVDDGSTDGSGEVASHFAPSIRYVHQTNMGTAAARNRGIGMAGGGFIALLDQDDIWKPNKLTVQVAAFRVEAELDIVFGNVELIRTQGLDGDMETETYSPPRIMPGYTPSAMLAKREAVIRVGPFGTHWRLAEWADWCVRATELGLRMRMLPDLVTWRRVHESNKGVIHRPFIGEYVMVLKASLDRRRSANSRPEGTRPVMNHETPSINRWSASDQKGNSVASSPHLDGNPCARGRLAG